MRRGRRQEQRGKRRMRSSCTPNKVTAELQLKHFQVQQRVRVICAQCGHIPALVGQILPKLLAALLARDKRHSALEVRRQPEDGRVDRAAERANNDGFNR